ncbi:SpcZ [Streptomyces sp. NBC_01476]|uniref:SpcZ n=1 Tax=Streptomyces sp. NBC_01476 TaxID=2903881 RepID=UPI002E32971D|nr:SpcZ [Streptomyces sp. NBC_01476]
MEPGTAAPPPWLDHVADVLFPEAGLRAGWTDRVERELVRHQGQLPMAAVHAWQCAGDPLLTGPEHRAVGALHRRTLTGRPSPEPVWRAALEPALRDLFTRAYPYRDAYAEAAAAAGAYARANGYAEGDARQYGEVYARQNTDTNRLAHVEANTVAGAAALAAAYAAGQPDGYAATFPHARVGAVVTAYADGDPGRARRARERIAAGLLHALAGPVGADGTDGTDGSVSP